jgi:dehydrogenase/reductase SDR family protein 12
MVCRNREKGQIQRDRISRECSNEHVYLLVADCGLEGDVRRLWSEFVAHRQSVASSISLSALICNAGSLTNTIQLTTEGIESTIATHLIFGTYLLVNLALSTLQSTAGSRVVVISSGGMYNTKFPPWDVATSKVGKYDGQLCYAYAKRAQVLCCERWTNMYSNVKFVSCHPGWVDTGGVDAAFGDKKSYLQPLRGTICLELIFYVV